MPLPCSIPIEGKIILGVIILLCLLVLIPRRFNIFCLKHFRFKDLKAYHPYDKRMYCTSCINDEANPKVKHGCGFSGRFSDLQEYSFNDDTIYRYYCPKCEKPISV